jgi:hypothetical protein
VDATNLKRTLTGLSHRLVTEQGFNPAAGPDPSTQPLDAFIRWLDDAPDAQEILGRDGSPKSGRDRRGDFCRKGRTNGLSPGERTLQKRSRLRGK